MSSTTSTIAESTPAVWTNVRVGILVGTNAARDAQGRVHINHANGRLIDAIAQRVGSAKLCLPLLDGIRPNMTHTLAIDPSDVVPLPPLASTINAQRHLLATRRVLRQFARSMDVLFVRLPFQLPRALLALKTPKLLHVAGDPIEAVRISSDYQGVWRWLAHGFARDGHRVMRRLVAEPETRTATNGADMWAKLGCRHGRVVVSSCLLESEMQPRQDFALHRPPRILFVGYLRPEKGVDTLLDAFDRVREKQPAELTIVGGSDRVTGAEAQIRERIEQSPFAQDITVRGMVDFGKELFDIYRDHDLYVLPSRSEGTPRSVVEARAFGCPVVATTVGGIPTSVRDGETGLLVPPDDPLALSDAMLRLLEDEPLRQRIAQTGVAEAPQFALDAFAGHLVAEMEQLVRPQAAAAR